ncbi:PDZ domain-containing protein [bacterium]|jgi:serine protease Do|nr:PDZ domain-containing protein [bacterium]
MLKKQHFSVQSGYLSSIRACQNSEARFKKENMKRVQINPNRFLSIIQILVAFVLVISLPNASTVSWAKESTVEGLPDMLERVSPGVVNISSTTIVHEPAYGMNEFFELFLIPQERKHTSLGSGFIIDQDGYILTNHHVVAKASEVLVTLSDQRKFKAKIIGKDEKMDLALIQIRNDKGLVPSPITPVEMGNSELVRIGETVVAVGNPFGLQNTVTRGIISAKNRTIGLGPFDNFLQTDASINPGNSGGPLFNDRGQVIGINSAIRSQTGQSSGLGFAIPINEAKELITPLKRYGRVPRPWLGIQAERMTPQLKHYYRLSTDRGILVFNLIDRGPADLAGLKEGDIIFKVENESVNDSYELERILAKHKPLEMVTLSIYRGSKMRDLKVKLEELPRLSHLPKGII